MKHLFLLGAMTLFSAFSFSQELKVSNERAATADPNQKQLPVSGEHAAETLVVRPAERAMHAINTEQSGQEKGEAANANLSGTVVMNPMERSSHAAVPASSGPSKGNTTGKPE